ncbi:MAG: oxaloacetate decarboxylase, partial [Methylococcaceae bacterium]|nr:oxaloacetate decarboxylase [Methylococcaceae bacterium]
VMNVLDGERYKTITKETAGVLKGEYGATPAPVNSELQDRVLEGKAPITCRPADLIEAEMDKLIAEVQEKAQAENVRLANVEEDALINGMFAQVGWKFLANRGNPAAFEAAPNALAVAATAATPAPTTFKASTETYSVTVDGRNFNVTVGPAGAPLAIQPAVAETTLVAPAASTGAVVYAPMAGNILKILVEVGSTVAEGEAVVIMEAMKMETEVRSKFAGIVTAVHIKEGGAVAGGNALITL